jgi:hypothetical protein
LKNVATTVVQASLPILKEPRVLPLVTSTTVVWDARGRIGRCDLPVEVPEFIANLRARAGGGSGAMEGTCMM